MSPASNAKQNTKLVLPTDGGSYILGADGKLVPNPDARVAPDGSTTTQQHPGKTELAKREAEAKAAADNKADAEAGDTKGAKRK